MKEYKVYMGKIKITKKEIDDILKIKGYIKGSFLKVFYSYVLEKKGEEGIKIIEKKLSEVNINLSLENIKSFKWYPISFVTIVLVLVLETFDWDESIAFDIGYNAISYSFLNRVLMNYVADLNFSSGGAEKYWKNQVSIGNLETVEYKKEEKYSIVRIKGFKKLHPTVYEYIKGFMAKFTETVRKLNNVKIEQTKSLYNNDPYDEFKTTWK